MSSPTQVLEADGCRAEVDLRHGARLASLTVAGLELVATSGKDTYHWGSFTLAPGAGRLRGGRFEHGGREFGFPLTAPPHAIHGLVVDVPWEQLGPASAGVELPAPWPWPGRVRQMLRLEPDRLESRLELHADEPMPAAMGWHPWFPRPLNRASDSRQLGPLKLDVHPGRMYAHGPDGLPTGDLIEPASRPWDYCFVDLAAPPRLQWLGDDEGFELSVESDCPCWVIYDEEPQAICVEPWTAPPNSLNLPNPTVVDPAKPLEAVMVWRWRSM